MNQLFSRDRYDPLESMNFFSNHIVLASFVNPNNLSIIKLSITVIFLQNWYHHVWLIWKSLLYQIEWRSIWNKSYFTGSACQGKCSCTFFTLLCISKYLSSEMDSSMFLKLGISSSVTNTAKDSQFKISKKGGIKLSDMITGMHSWNIASTTRGLLTSWPLAWMQNLLLFMNWM